MFLGMGPLELVIILAVVLIIFGPKNLPKLGESLGKTVKSVREGMEEGESEAKPKKAEEPAQVEAATATAAEDVVVEPESSDGVFCTACGTKNEAGAAFCKNCGNKLSEE